MDGSRPPTPERILALAHGFWASQILATAAGHRFFTLIADGHDTTDELASAAGTDPRGTRMIADALVALELLTKDDGRYGLAPDASAFLVEGRTESLTDFVAGHPQLLWADWGRLSEAVKTGRPATDIDRSARAREFFPRLVRMIMPLGLRAADAAAEHFGVGERLTGVRVLDVGAGAASWSIPFARRDRDSQVTAFDLPEVLEHTKAVTDERGVGDRYRFQAGDYRTDEFGEASFDFVLFGNVCHIESPGANQALFGKAHRALRPGGRVLIGDMIPNDDRTGPPFPAMFAVNMFLHADRGDTYTLSQYRTWLEGAGFAQVTTVDTDHSPSPLVVGTKV